MRHRRYTSSGQAAIAAALRALGIGSGDKVLVPTYHCPTMIAPVVRSGARPVFYPITAYGAVDLDGLQHVSLAGVRALLAAHYFGVPQPMSKLRAFCDAHAMALIEDCAHAFFGTCEGRPVGSWGDFAIASLTKFFPVPEGGLILSATRPLETLDLEPREWGDEVRAAVDAIELGAMHGRFPGMNVILRSAVRLKHRLRGRRVPGGAPTEPDGLAAEPPSKPLRSTATTRWIVERVSQTRIVERRRDNYMVLASALKKIEGARALYPDLQEGVTPYVFPLYVENPAAAYRQLRSLGAPLFRWDELWPGTPTLKGDTGRDWADRVFQLACHQELSAADVEAVAATVRSAIGS